MPKDYTDAMATAEMQVRRWTSEEYYRMSDAGIFGPQERVELLEGEILSMTAQNPRHANVITQINEILVVRFTGRFYVRCQVPLDLGIHSQPEPDFALVRREASTPQGHPTAAELVLEVADTSLRLDRIRKLRVYARAGIPEYWIANLQANQLEVMRKPTRNGSYKDHRIYAAGDEVACLAAPEMNLSVALLLGC